MAAVTANSLSLPLPVVPRLQLAALLSLAPVLLGLLQARSIFLALISLGILFVLGLGSIRNAVEFPRLPLVLLCVYLMYALVNTVLVNGLSILLDVNFLRFDGKQFATLMVFPLSLLAFHPRGWLSDYRPLAEIVLIVAIAYLPLAMVFGEWRHGLLNGFHLSHNALAGVSGSLAIIAIGYIVATPSTETLRRLFGVVALLLSLVVFSFAGSRAFMLGLVAAVFYWSLISSQSTRTRILLGFGTLAVLGALIVAGPLGARLDISSIGSDPNVLTRFRYWLRALEYFAASPIVGVGIGTFNDSFVQLREVFPGVAVPVYSVQFLGEHHAHNVLLHVAAEQGVVGLTLLALFWFSILFRRPGPISFSRDPQLRIFRTHCMVIRTLFIYLVVASMFGVNLLVMSTAFLFYIFAGSFVQSTLPLNHPVARGIAQGTRRLTQRDEEF